MFMVLFMKNILKAGAEYLVACIQLCPGGIGIMDLLVVEAAVLSKYFKVMRWILKPSASGLSLSNWGSGFYVTKDSDELNGSKESNESSLVDI